MSDTNGDVRSELENKQRPVQAKCEMVRCNLETKKKKKIKAIYIDIALKKPVICSGFFKGVNSLVNTLQTSALPHEPVV